MLLDDAILSVYFLVLFYIKNIEIMPLCDISVIINWIYSPLSFLLYT